jgi:hypothetical protein
MAVARAIPWRYLGGEPRGDGVVEGGAQGPLLDELRRGALAAEFEGGVEEHRGVDHGAVEEGHADLKAVGHGGLVRTQAVKLVQRVHLPHAFLVELAAVGGLVEVQITRQRFIRPFS